MAFINGITLLLAYQLLGELVVKLLKLPIPGPVAGMLFLFITLLLRRNLLAHLQQPATHILSHLSLLFIPAGVGIMVYVNLVAAQWQAIVITLVISSLLTMAAIGLAMKLTIKWLQKE
jgi:holin-like protein